MRRYERLEKLDDVNTAITLLTDALALTPHTHSNMPTILANLGNANSSRVERTVDPEVLINAIHSSLRAVAMAPGDQVGMPS